MTPRYSTTLPLPEPSGGVAYYDAEREARFAFDERTRENYERWRQAQNGVATVDYLPVKLDVENVSRCNLRCPMCAVSTWPKGKRAADMKLEDFKRLIDAQYGLVEIKLNGLGEALMQGDAYFAMVRYARAKRIWVRMTTNATLLHLHGKMQKLIDADVNEIDISIDGADRATYSKIRVGGVFEQVVRNASTLNGLLTKRNRVRTKMWTLVQRDNVERLENHVRLASGMGFKHAVFSLNLHGWGNDALAERNRTVSAALSEERLLRLVEIGRGLGVRVSFWDVADKFTKENRCPWPFSRAVVTSDLRTVACCMIGDPDKHELGKGLTFADAWRSDEYVRFRQAHIDGEVPAICKGCYR